MSAVMERKPDASALVEKVVIHGDLSKLSSQERVQYYAAVCDSVGLNPLTQPFAYITLNGKLTLYALRAATDQLRSVKGVSIEIKARELVDDVYAVTAQARMGQRQDESIGAVNLKGLVGDAKANAMMKAETKAKRRVTLSICGLGLLDETEVETIPGAVSTVTPNAGAGDGMTNKRKSELADLAIRVKDKLAEGKEWDGYSALEVENLELEDKLYLWTQFDSKERAALKRMQQAERNQEPKE